MPLVMSSKFESRIFFPKNCCCFQNRAFFTVITPTVFFLPFFHLFIGWSIFFFQIFKNKGVNKSEKEGGEEAKEEGEEGRK